MTSPNRPNATGSIGSLAGFAGRDESSWRSIFQGPIDSLFTWDALFGGITGAINGLFAPLSGVLTSRGFGSVPPSTTAASGVVASLDYLTNHVASLQSGSEASVFVTNGTWMKPPKAKFIEVHTIAGGGGGGRGSRNTANASEAGLASTVSNHGTGGGGGGWTREVYDANLVADVLTVEIGLGGAGGVGDGEFTVIGGSGSASRVRKPDGVVLLSSGGGTGGGNGYADAPSDSTKGINGYGNMGSFSSGGDGGQGPGVTAVLTGIVIVVPSGGFSWTAIPARVTPPQSGGPGPFSQGGFRPGNLAQAGSTGIAPLFPEAFGPGSGASGGMWSDDGNGMKGGRGGHGTAAGAGGGGGGSSSGSTSNQNPGNGGNGGQGIVYIIARFS